MLNELIEVKRRIIELIVIVILLGFGMNILANSVYQIYANTFFWFVLSITIIVLAGSILLYLKYFVYNLVDENFIFLIVFNNKQCYIPSFNLSGFTILSYVSQFFDDMKEEFIKQDILMLDIGDIKKNNLLLDLIEFAVIWQISTWYKFFWLPKSNVKGYSTEFMSFEDRPKKIIKFEDLNEGFKEKNTVASKLEKKYPISFAVPENTQLKFTQDEHSRKIIFINKFLTIDISITLTLERAGIPLLIDGIPKEAQNNFSSSFFIINFKIIPNKIKMLCSLSSEDYYRWAKSIFIRLKDDMYYEEKINGFKSRRYS